MNILFFLRPKCDIAYISKSHTLRQALEKVKYHGYTAIPVLDQEGRYFGTLSEGDLLWAIVGNPAEGGSLPGQLRVKDILKSRQNKPVNVNASIDDLFHMAMDQNFIPVIDDRDLFIGIVTRKDILQYYYKKIHKIK